MPNFLIIGAMKCGTTSLHNYLSCHPQIFMSPMKEPKFFVYENCPQPKYCGLDKDHPAYRGAVDRRRGKKYPFAITQLADYEDLFSKAQPGNAIGESSPLYLYHPRAAERIQHHVPHARLIAVLRNPVDRAYSQFKYHRKRGMEPIDEFAKALEMEPVRIQRDWYPAWFYKQRGFYYQQLKRYYGRFDRNQIRIYLYNNFCSDPEGMLKDIFRFLGVDETFIPDLSRRFNAGEGPMYRPKVEAVDRFLNNPNTIKSVIKKIMPLKLLRHIKARVENKNIGSEFQFIVPPMSDEIRMQLQNEYREDILKLQDLIGKDLSGWLV